VIDDDTLQRRVREALDSVYRPAPGLLGRCIEAVERSRRRSLLRGPLAAAALAAAAVIVAVATLVHHQLSQGTLGPAASPAPSPAGLVFTIDADNQVAALDATTLQVRWRRPAAPSPSSGIAPGDLLQLSPDGATLWALPPADARGGTALHSFDAATGAAGKVIALSTGGGTIYRALAVDSRRDSLYAVGIDAAHIVVTTVDLRRGVVLSTAATRTLPSTPAVGLDLPSDAAVTPDGTRLYYSFGGADEDRAGIDWLTIGAGVLTPCTPAKPGAACIPGFVNRIAFSGDHLLTTDSVHPQHLVEMSADGAVLRTLGTGLGGGASDGVVVDSAHGTATLLGGCPALGGMAGIDLGTGQAHVLAAPAAAGNTPAPDQPCGVRAVALRSGLLAASRVVAGTATAGTPGTVELIDPATGRVVRQAVLRSEVVDVVGGAQPGS
jgi:hypothetical protein